MIIKPLRKVQYTHPPSACTHMHNLCVHVEHLSVLSQVWSAGIWRHRNRRMRKRRRRQRRRAVMKKRWKRGVMNPPSTLYLNYWWTCKRYVVSRLLKKKCLLPPTFEWYLVSLKKLIHLFSKDTFNSKVTLKDKYSVTGNTFLFLFIKEFWKNLISFHKNTKLHLYY